MSPLSHMTHMLHHAQTLIHNKNIRDVECHQLIVSPDKVGNILDLARSRRLRLEEDSKPIVLWPWPSRKDQIWARKHKIATIS